MTQNTKAAVKRVRQKGSPNSGEITREALLDVAWGFFRHKGYANTSLRDVVATLGIKVPAIYYHFKSKDELFAEATSRHLGLWLDQHQRLGSGCTASERIWLFVALHVMLQFVPGQSNTSGHSAEGITGLIKIIGKEHKKTVVSGARLLFDRARGIVAEGVASGEFGKVSVTPATFALFGISHHVTTWFHPNGAMSIEDVAIINADLAVSMLGGRVQKKRAQLLKLIHAARSEN